MKVDKRTRNFLYAIFFIIIVFVVLIVGTNIKREEPLPTVEYNHFVFQKMAGLWHTQWSREGTLYTVSLHFNPYEVERVPAMGKLNDTNFNRETVYITFDPEDGNLNYVNLAVAEMSLSIARAFEVTPIAACAENKTIACENRPIVDCDSEDKAVIYVRKANETRILLDDNCVILQGKDLELLKAVDKFLYVWYGIIS